MTFKSEEPAQVRQEPLQEPLPVPPKQTYPVETSGAIAPIAAPQPGPNAPPAPVHNGKAYWIKVQAKQDGSFTVTNQRNGFSKTYAVPGS